MPALVKEGGCGAHTHAHRYLVSRLAHHAAGPFREQYDEHGTRVYTATGGQWAVEQQRLADAEEEHLLGLDFAWDKAQLGQVGNQNMYPVYVRDVQCPVSAPSLESCIESHASYSMGLAATSLQPHHPHMPLSALHRTW